MALQQESSFKTPAPPFDETEILLNVSVNECVENSVILSKLQGDQKLRATYGAATLHAAKLALLRGGLLEYLN